MNSYKIDYLKDNNYDSWKLQVKAILIKNETWDYVTGKKKKPEEKEGSEDETEKWNINDQKAMSDIILTIHPTQLSQVKNCKTSSEMWEKLQSIYQSKGPAKKATLLKQLTQLRMNETENVAEYLRKYFEIVDKLSEMQVDINKDLLAILLLNSLPESYNVFRCAIESRDTLPDLETLKVKLLEESESIRNKSNSSDTNALLVKKPNYRPKKGNIYVKKYNNRDSEEKCNEKFKFKCHGCGEVGHKIAFCRKNRKDYGHKPSNFNIVEESQYTEENERKYIWCLDSGCTSHMTRSEEKFENLESSEVKKLNLASSATTDIKSKGNVKFVARIGKQNVNVNLSDVYHVTDLRMNLLSVAKIVDQGNKVIFKKEEAVVIDECDGRVKLIAKRRNGLFYVDEEFENCNNTYVENSQEFEKLHKKFGHLNEMDLKRLMSNEQVKGINVRGSCKMKTCEICMKGKFTRLPFKKENNRKSEILEIIHTDICGPIKVKSNGGSQYFITFTDDYSRWTEVRFLKKKYEVLDAFKNYKRLVENQTGRRIKNIQSDNGGEYCSREFDKYLEECGIKRRLTTPYTPQQNGVSERKNRTLVEMARCMLLEAKLPASFWAEAVATANHIRNRSPSASINWEIPYVRWTGRMLNVSYLQVFGTKGFILDKTPGKGKFDKRAKDCIFVGYSDTSKGYRVWVPEERNVKISRDVKFIYQNDTSCQDRQQVAVEDLFNDVKINTESDHDDDENKTNKVLIQIEERKPRISANDEDKNNEEMMQEESEGDSANVESNGETSTENVQRLPGRPKIMRSGTRGRPKRVYNTRIIEDANTVEHNERKIEAEEWKEAIQREFESLVEQDTWEIVDRPTNRNVIGCKLILTNKYKANGEIERRKARLVAKGYTQRIGVDFYETFAPVARLSSIRTVLALAVKHNMSVHQMDVTTAYLNGKIDTDIYMEMPNMFEEILERIVKTSTRKEICKRAKRMLEEVRNENKVCLIKKALYGLKQAGRQWYKTLHEELNKIGLKSLNSDPCVYKRRINGDIVIVVVYVDDILILSKNKEEMENLKRKLMNTFRMKDLGKIHYCLGIEFTHDENEGKMFMSQKSYIEDVLKRFHMEACKEASTPLEPNIKLCKPENQSREMNKYPYQQLIGSLMYLAVATRPDIAYAVSLLSQFNTNYEKRHWDAAKRVLRYLKGTSDYGIYFSKNQEELKGFADADWGGCINDRRSYTGYCFKLSSGAISWESRKQRTVALSSTEAEYMGLSEAVKEAVYLRKFFEELEIEETQELIIYNDNQGAAKLAKNSQFHGRTKHIDIRYHFIRDVVEDQKVTIKYIRSEDMSADILTKSLSKKNHVKCTKELGLEDASCFSTA